MLHPGDKVVLATFGTSGDLFPFIGLGRALQALGMQPVIATSRYYRALVESHGLAFHEAAPDEERLEADLGEPFAASMRRAMHRVTGPRFGITRVVLPYLAESYAQLDAACRGAALLVSHSYTFAAPLVAERSGVPWRSLCLQPLSFLSAFDAAVLSDVVPLHRLQRVLGARRYGQLLRLAVHGTRHWFEPVDALRRALGLPASRRHPLFEAQFAPDGVFAMFDPMLMPDTRGLPPHVRFAGFVHSDGSDGRLPPALQAFVDAGPAPIVFTLGTSAVHNPGRFYEYAAAACRELGRRAVFLCGDATFDAPLPVGSLAVPWASHAALFPHAAVVVHQGGMGTCGQALRAGVPELVVPFANDQPDNAARLVRLGVGLSVGASRLTRARMTRALRPLLTEPRFADAARERRAALMPRDGAATVAQWLSHSPRDP